ncbi:unnamed protein product [Rhizophagus irregularis]|nr:unnamed protein product [Rhizophagus irregularis]
MCKASCLKNNSNWLLYRLKWKYYRLRILHTAMQYNKGALSNLEQVVSTITSAKSETENKQAFDNYDNQAQPSLKKASIY